MKTVVVNEENLHILLAEDNPDHALLICKALEGTGDNRVQQVANGEQALAALQQTVFDLLLLDYSLPKINGLQVLSRLRDAGHTLPVIMVTSQGDEHVAVTALKAGAADYVVKEWGYLETLPLTIHNTVRTHRLAAEQAALRQIYEALDHNLDLPTIYRTLYDCLRPLVDCTNFAVARFDEATRTLSCAFAAAGGKPVAPERFSPCLLGSSLLGQVLQSRQPLIIADLLTTPPHLGEPGVQEVEAISPELPPRSALYAPLICQDMPLGVLVFQSPVPHRYRQADADLLMAVAHQAAVVIHSAALYTRAKRREEQVHLAAEVGREISAILDEPTLLHRVVALIQERFDLYNVNIFLREGDQVELVAAQGGHTGDPPLGMCLPPGQGIVGRAMQEQKALNVPDVFQDERYHEGLPDTRSELAVPICIRNEIAGVLDAQSRQVAAFDATDQRVMQLVADQVGTALQNARAHHAAILQSRELAALNEVIAAAAASLNVQSVLERSLDAALAALSLDRGSIFVTDEQATVTHVINRGYRDRFLAQIQETVPPTRGHRTTIFVEDLNGYDSPLTPLLQGENIGAFITVPVRIRETVCGGLTAADTGPRHFTSAEVRLLEAVGSQVGIAVERAQVFEAEQAARRREETLHQQVMAAYEELREAQFRLVQAEKLSAIGQLVAGVAHEINNPLQGIIGFSELLSQGHTLEDKERAADYVNRIRHDADRVRRIVQNLLSFARQHDPQRELASINDLLQRTLDLRLYPLHTGNIEVEADLDPNLPITVIDPYQLQQVFLNLVINAEQSMSDAYGAGHLIVRSRLVGEDTIRVEIEDDGPGIPEDQISKIFDPFFTTKEVGQGTGLGLSICYGIVQEHNGRIWAESPVQDAPAEHGPGTRFVVEFPLQKSSWVAEILAVEKTKERATAPPLRILVVDDEEAVTSLLADALKAQGHQVDCLGQAEKALAHLEQNPCDLIFCDLKMPGMGGRSFYEQLAAHSPALAKRMVFITGDTASPATRKFLKSTGQPFLEKPFALDTVYQLAAEGRSEDRRIGGAGA